MTLSIVDPGMIEAAADWYLSQSGITRDADPSVWHDSADAAPTFDTQHVVYTSSPQDAASQDAIGDNSNGLEDPLHLVPSLSYAYTTGYSTTHTISAALTESLTQALNYQFIGPAFGGGHHVQRLGVLQHVRRHDHQSQHDHHQLDPGPVRHPQRQDLRGEAPVQPGAGAGSFHYDYSSQRRY